MKAVVLLADAAKVAPDGKVYALGLGWSQTVSPTPAATLVLLIRVPWDLTNVKHTLVIELLDADGSPVPARSSGPGSTGVVRMEGEFEAGRPTGILPGTPIERNVTLDIAPGLPLAVGQAYEWRVTINGNTHEDWRARFFVRGRAQQ